MAEIGVYYKLKNSAPASAAAAYLWEAGMNMQTYGLRPYGACPSARQMEWYRRERTIFFHFGMNTFSDREWGDGTEDPASFDPSQLDCRQWISTIKQAGFTMAILTAKHHDGFCLWPSKYTEHSVKNSPYKGGKGDIVREFTDACREFGIKAGIYLSPWDRHEKTWGTEAYNDFYVNQLTELLTGYGKIWECWWDGAGSTEARYDWDRWASTVRTLQPDAVIFGSLGATPHVEVRWVGNENGIAGDPCFATIDPHELEVENCEGLNRGTPDGLRFIPGEADVSIRPGWFYHDHQDADVRTPKNLLKLWFHSVGRNTGLLLNLPPDRRGLVHEADAQSLLRFGSLLEASMQTDLARSAHCTASSVRCPECAPQKLLDGCEETFYAPSDDCRTPTVELCFDAPVRFNTVYVSELIELGHKVRSFRLEVWQDGWQTVFSAACIGYRQCAHFDTVCTQRVRLVITEAVDVPAIRTLSLYHFDEALFAEETAASTDRDLLSAPSASVEQCGDETVVDLGGIFPYNTVEFDCAGEGSCELSVFNGTAYEQPSVHALHPGHNVCVIDTVTYSYKFKLRTTADISGVAVFCK